MFVPVQLSSPEGLEDGSSPIGSRSEAPVRVWKKLKQFADIVYRI